MPSDPSPPRDRDDRERSRLDRMLPDLVKKLVDVGVEKIADGPESLRHILADAKLPKEAIQLLVSQLDEGRKDVARVVAREIREFLERASLADEFTKLLSGLTLEVKTQIRFVPNTDSSGSVRPKVKTKLGLHVDSEPTRGPAEPSSERPNSQAAPIRSPSNAPCASDGAAPEQERLK